MAKQKTKKSKLIIRASFSGVVMTEKKGAVITPIQLKILQERIDRKNRFMSDQIRNRKDKLTEKMEAEMEMLIAKRDAPFELSDTAKGKIEEVWRMTEKNIPTIVTSKYMEKGTFQEQLGRQMISEVDQRLYKRNTERKKKGALSGVCDVFDEMPDKKIIHDIKCCWDSKTFMNAYMTKLQEWQGRSYMELWNADEFWLRFCLVDCPDHIYENELYKFKLNNGIIDDSNPEYEEKLDNFRRTIMFSDNPNLTVEERVKTIKITRDKKLFKEFNNRVPACHDYYNSIKFNQIGHAEV